MIEYVILGTSHPDPQDSPIFGEPLTKAIQSHLIRLVAEEHPLDTLSMACVTTKHLHIPYLQIDPFPAGWAALGIDREMRARQGLLMGEDIRLSNADSVREGFWLEKIEASLDSGRVLVICGYLHVNFLCQKIEERSGSVIEKTSFPGELVHREPDMILDPAGLQDYLEKLRADRLYGKRDGPPGHSGEAETR